MDNKPYEQENTEINSQPNNQIQPPIQDELPAVDDQAVPYEALEAEPATTSQPQAPGNLGMLDSTTAQPNYTSVAPAGDVPSQFGAVTTPADVPSPTPPKKSKKKLLFIVAGIFLLVSTLGAGAFASYRFYQSPETVMIGAVSHLMRADHIQANTVITSDQVSDIFGVKIAIKKVTIGNKSDYTPANGTDAEIELSVNDKPYKFGGSVITVASGDIYFKLDAIVSTFEDIVRDSDEFADDSAELNMTKLKELEGKWVKFAMSDMKELSAEYSDTYKCTLEAYKQYGNDKAMTEEVINAYKANQFIATKGDAKYKDGMIGYDVEVKKQKLKDFTKSLQKTAIYKKIAACDKTKTIPESDDSTTSDSIDETIDEVDSAYSTINTLWFGQWTHELKQFDSSVGYAPKDEKSSTTRVKTLISYDNTVKIEAPKDSMSFKDFQEKLTAGYEQMVSLPEGAIAERAQDSSSIANTSTIYKKAEAYNAIAGTYPVAVADFEKYQESSLKAWSSENGISTVPTLPMSEKQYTYKKCSAGNTAQVVYKKSDGTYVATGLGGAPSGTITKLC